MSIQKTRCPFCSSIFLVNDAQLAARNGLTRCGKCFQVFKADDHFLPEKNAAPSPAAQTSPVNSVYSIDPSLVSGKSTESNTEPSSPKGIDAPTMSPKFEKEFNELWLAGTDDGATPVAVKAAQPNVTVSETTSAEPKLKMEFNDLWLTETNVNATPPTPQPPLSKLSTASPPKPVSTEDNAPPAPVPSPTRIIPPPTPTQPNKKTSKAAVQDDDLISFLNQNNVESTTLNRQLNLNETKALKPKVKAPKNPLLAEEKPRKNAADRLKEIPKFKVNLLKLVNNGVMSFLMLALLIYQIVYFNFDRLAANPKYNPFMHDMCSHIGCDVPYVNIHQIKLSKVLARHYPGNPKEDTRFTATMVNQATESQPFPVLQLLVLKNGLVVSGRNIQPSEYLAQYSPLMQISPHTPMQISFILKIPREEIPVFALDPTQ